MSFVALQALSKCEFIAIDAEWNRHASLNRPRSQARGGGKVAMLQLLGYDLDVGDLNVGSVSSLPTAYLIRMEAYEGDLPKELRDLLEHTTKPSDGLLLL